MKRAIAVKIGLAVIGILVCGPGMAQEPEIVLGGNSNERPNAPDAARIIFGSNLLSDPCARCNYSTQAYAVIGPDNCTSPGSTQWLAGMFIASATGVPERISAAITLWNPDCLQNKVTLTIHADACNFSGVGTPLASGIATVPETPCDLAVAELLNPPTLTKGEKYWVTATTSDEQTGLDSSWHGSSNAQYATNTGSGWQHGNVGTPAFKVEGSGTLFSQQEPAARSRRLEAICFWTRAPGAFTTPPSPAFTCGDPITARYAARLFGLPSPSSRPNRAFRSASRLRLS